MVSRFPSRLAGGTAVLNRLAAHGAARLTVPPPLPALPEPQGIGHFARGRQIVAGHLRLGGQQINLSGQSLWDAARGPALTEAQEFKWLDDLAAVGDAAARTLAQRWTTDWIARFGKGQGWTPETVARRMLRLIDHAAFLTRGTDPAPLALVLARQARFLSRRAHAAPQGPARLATRVAQLRVALFLPDLGLPLPTAALVEECRLSISPQGDIATRNPEELLDLFTLLLRGTQALTEADHTPPEPVLSAIGAIAPCLRSLRHADGGLPRLHGGDRGLDGQLDLALAASGIRSRAAGPLHMGYARLSAGRTTVIIDAAPPPKGPEAHASTLSFELTSGRRPLIVNCGPGLPFGPDWGRAGRATPSHSTLCLDGHSSSRLAPGDSRLADGPTRVICEHTPLTEGLRIETAHDGWVKSHGLTHARTLDLSQDGRSLSGEDLLTTLSTADRATFDRTSRGAGFGFTIRFHLHPDVTVLPEGQTVALALRSGEVWIFRQDGAYRLAIEPSVYLDSTRLQPRPTQQVVLFARTMSYATRVRWSLAKAEDTPRGLRDLAQGDSADETED
jgi:uncharacterized heparinase superfamily protein